MFILHIERLFSIADSVVVYRCEYNADFYSDKVRDLYVENAEVLFSKMVKKRKADFLAGRICAVRCLTQFGYAKVQVGVGSDGSPSWPEGIVGSISHTGTTAIAAVSKTSNLSGLGIDIEHFISEQTARKLSQQILTDVEISILLSNTRHSISFARDLTLIFSAKESIFKALYPTVGRHFGFHAVQLLELDEISLSFVVVEHINAAYRTGAFLKVMYEFQRTMVMTWCHAP